MKSIKKAIFYDSPIEKLVLPSTLEYISDECFDSIDYLTAIEVSPKNNIFTVISNKYLVRKSDENSQNFDVIVSTRRETSDTSQNIHLIDAVI